jgi:glycosyltransferase involved in cell wall biosynthesis
MTILHLLPDFDYSSAARQAAVLAASLRDRGSPERPELSIHVAAAGPPGPTADWFKAAGVTVHALGRRRRFAFSAGWQLRRLVGELSVDVVHAWRRPAWRAAATLPRRLSGPALVVSQPSRGGRPLPLDRWLLRRAERVVAENAAEADAIRAVGVSFDRVTTIRPAVSLSSRAQSPLPADVGDARVVMCIGPIRLGHGFRDAIWAFDVLRYVYPDLRLVIVGDGAALPGLQRFARAVGYGDGRIHFLPHRPDAAGLLHTASVVWVPSRTDCGHQVALEALAAGRPVVATRLPGLAAVIDDGRTGLLVPPGEPVALVAATRRLFDDSSFAGRLVEAGRQAAIADHAPAEVAVRLADLYTMPR